MSYSNGITIRGSHEKTAQAGSALTASSIASDEDKIGDLWQSMAAPRMSWMWPSPDTAPMALPVDSSYVFFKHPTSSGGTHSVRLEIPWLTIPAFTHTQVDLIAAINDVTYLPTLRLNFLDYSGSDQSVSVERYIPRGAGSPMPSCKWVQDDSSWLLVAQKLLIENPSSAGNYVLTVEAKSEQVGGDLMDLSVVREVRLFSMSAFGVIRSNPNQ